MNIAVFMIFVFLLFATMGLQQYNGTAYNSCRLAPYPSEDGTWPSDLSFERPCTMNGLGNFHCPEGLTCGNIAQYPDIDVESEAYHERSYLNY